MCLVGKINAYLKLFFMFVYVIWYYYYAAGESSEVLVRVLVGMQYYGIQTIGSFVLKLLMILVLFICLQYT